MTMEFTMVVSALEKYEEKEIALDFIDAELDAGCTLCDTLCEHNERLILIRSTRDIIRHELATLKFLYKTLYNHYVKKILHKSLGRDVTELILCYDALL